MSKEQIDRFTMEQDIMECWGVVDDIKVLVNTERLTTNPAEMQQALEAVQVLYQIKFERLFNIFETMIADGNIK
jgi:hypothetical protein